MAHFSVQMQGQDISRSYRIAVRPQTAGRADKVPPPRFVFVTALGIWTSAAGVCLVLQDYLNAVCGDLVGEIGAQPTVRPLADLLLADAVQPLAVGHATHIAVSDLLHSALAHPLGAGPADFVLDVTHLSPCSGQQPVLGPLQAPPGPASFDLGRLFALDCGLSFVAPVLDGLQLAGGDDQRSLAIGRDQRVNLSGVNGSNAVARRRSFAFMSKEDDQ